MDLRGRLPSAFLAACLGASALASAWTVGRVVHAAALRTSHEHPVADSWLEPATPTSPLMVSRGRKLFLGSCAHCHGADASGDEGPDLHGLEVSDRYIAHMITFGEPHEMPSFAKKHGAADISAITAYLRTLAPDA
jgi:mono/diheme cytochrome c family protein